MLGAAVVGVAVAAVAIALAVVAATRPSDADVRRAVAGDLGVPEPLLDLPLVDRLVARAAARAKDSVTEELDSSLALGAVAGVLGAVLGAVGVVWLARRAPFGTSGRQPEAPPEPPSEPGGSGLGGVPRGDVARGKPPHRHHRVVEGHDTPPRP